MKLCGTDDLGACFQSFSWDRSLYYGTHQHCQREGLIRFELEVIFHRLVIWLTHAKTWQERMEVVNT